MLVKEVMTREVIAVSPEESVGEVAKLIIGHRIHGLPVVEDGVPIGIITETDFFTKGAMTVYLPEYIDFLKRDVLLDKLSETEKKKIAPLLETKARDIMSSPCTVVDEDAQVADFFRLVKENELASVPVVDKQKKLTGIITLFDIIHLINIAPAEGGKK